MSGRIDTIDERILYYLTDDARHTSAPDIAEKVSVSAPTIRNRIRHLEKAGIIEGHHAHINYERAKGLLTNQFICSTSATDRQKLALRVLDVPGVVNVREVMAGRNNLRVKAVGTDTDDLTRIAQDITALGIEIEDEDLIHREYFRPYAPFGPREEERISPVTGVSSLAGGADVVELIVKEGAPIAGRSLHDANEDDLIPPDVLVVRIDRDDQAITPTGETEIKEGDFVTIHSRSGIPDETIEVFTDS